MSLPQRSQDKIVISVSSCYARMSGALVTQGGGIAPIFLSGFLAGVFAACILTFARETSSAGGPQMTKPAGELVRMHAQPLRHGREVSFGQPERRCCQAERRDGPSV